MATWASVTAPAGALRCCGCGPAVTAGLQVVSLDDDEVTWRPATEFSLPPARPALVPIGGDQVMLVGGPYEMDSCGCPEGDLACTHSRAARISIADGTAADLTVPEHDLSVVVAQRTPEGVRVLNPAAELLSYRLATDTWQVTAPITPALHHATGLADGRLLLFGPPSTPPQLRAVYDPDDGSLTPTVTTGAAVAPATAPLPDGRLLVTGDRDGVRVEVFDPSTLAWSDAAPFDRPLFELALAPLADGRVLATGRPVGGTPPSAFVARLYDPASDQWTLGPSLPGELDRHTLTPLADGRILATDLYHEHTAFFDAATGRWEQGPIVPLFNTAAVTVLADGRVVVAGSAR